MRVCYVAGPYRAKTKLGIIINILKARKVAKEYWAMGYSVICPHTNSGLISGLPEANFLNGYLEQLKRADFMVVLPGYRKSSGTMAEIKLAYEEGIPIVYRRD